VPRRRRATPRRAQSVCGTSLLIDTTFDIEPPGVTRALFFGLGADGTVGANKNSVKILAGPMVTSLSSDRRFVAPPCSLIRSRLPRFVIIVTSFSIGV
jgi:hypothetical protein